MWMLSFSWVMCFHYELIDSARSFLNLTDGTMCPAWNLMHPPHLKPGLVPAIGKIRWGVSREPLVLLSMGLNKFSFSAWEWNTSFVFWRPGFIGSGPFWWQCSSWSALQSGLRHSSLLVSKYTHGVSLSIGLSTDDINILAVEEILMFCSPSTTPPSPTIFSNILKIIITP